MCVHTFLCQRFAHQSGGLCLWMQRPSTVLLPHADCKAASQQVVLVKDVETTLCSTYERWAAFEAAMGGGGGGGADDASSSGVLRRPLVLLGGCGLSLAAATAPQARSAVLSYAFMAAPAACRVAAQEGLQCCYSRVWLTCVSS